MSRHLRNRSSRTLRLERPTVFFRSLSTMVAAGVPLLSALELLADTQSDPQSAEVAHRLADRLATGSTLSHSFSAFPQIFSSYQLGLIQMGEKTGALVVVLKNLTEHLERQEALKLKLRSSITYPLFLVAGSLLLMLFAPGYVLQGQIALLERSGQSLPLLTRVMSSWVELSTSPSFLLGGACFLFLGLYWLRTRFQGQHFLLKLHRLPVSSGILKTIAAARFARAMALAIKAGVPALDALTLSAEASGDPLLKARTVRIREALIGGEPLSESFRTVGFFDETFCALVESGEESGKLPELLSLSADYNEMEIDHVLQNLTTLLEPALLLVMGVFTALVLVATLQPTLSLLQSL